MWGQLGEPLFLMGLMFLGGPSDGAERWDRMQCDQVSSYQSSHHRHAVHSHDPMWHVAGPGTSTVQHGLVLACTSPRRSTCGIVLVHAPPRCSVCGLVLACTPP